MDRSPLIRPARLTLKIGNMEKIIEILIDNCNIPEGGCVLYENQFEKVAIEIFEALNPTSDSKREPSGERKQIIELRHWSEQKEDYIDAVVCGVNCNCSDLECKF